MNQLNNNQITNEPSDAPTLCNSCFEFFGSKHTDGLCSGCFKTKCKEELSQVKPISIAPDNSDAKTDIETPSASHKVSIDEESLAIEAPKPIVEAVVEDKPKPKPKETNKCHKCSKKVSVLGFKCKCDATFCKAHRLPEDHDCDFDFKLAGAAKLTKENPVIVASKISKI